MARGMNRRRTALALPITLAVLGSLAGCASTEELYAEYDQRMCLVESIAPAAALPDASPLTLRELIARSNFPWEPAVYFDFNSAALGPEELARLDGATDVLARFPNVKVSLQGFTDRIGSSSYNVWLAGLRVDSVRKVLISRGASPSQLVSQPLGEGLPVISSDDEEARAINRRVELMLLDEIGRPVHPMFDFDAFERSGQGSL